MDKKAMLMQLIQHYEDGNKTRFAKRLGLTPQGISTWLSRGTIDYELVYAKCEYLNAAWLLTGHGSMLRNDQEQPAPQLAAPVIPTGEESIIYKMYQDQLKAAQGEKEGKEALIKENGRLEERLRTLESKLHEYESQPETLKGAIDMSGHAKDASTKKPSSPNADNATSVTVP